MVGGCERGFNRPVWGHKLLGPNTPRGMCAGEKSPLDTGENEFEGLDPGPAVTLTRCPFPPLCKAARAPLAPRTAVCPQPRLRLGTPQLVPTGWDEASSGSVCVSMAVPSLLSRAPRDVPLPHPGPSTASLRRGYCWRTASQRPQPRGFLAPVPGHNFVRLSSHFIT